ncbi:hypothetical protein [Bacillus toyonensis]|uniref:hypothetical protein n=1 Tax=Bacillus toyonensis TaxID=155322 RepID=UPI000BF814EC|nr:hypothetical protein [Bacillus toyonensis]PGE75443.1 hypothetical protein COM58_17675 [Bacillus toyonensis]
MDPQKELEFYKKIYNTMYTIVTTGFNGGEGIANKETSYVHLSPIGMAVNPKEFENMNTASSSGETANKTASENFSRFVNAIPEISPVYGRTLINVEQVYEVMLNANVIADEKPDADAVREYNDAIDILYEDYKNDIKSKRYENYEEKRIQYKEALTIYNSLFVLLRELTPDMTPEKRIELEAKKATYDAIIDKLLKEFMGPYKDVENALAITRTRINMALTDLFANEKIKWERTKISSPLNESQTFHYCFAHPSNWYSPDATGFTSIELSSEVKDESTTDVHGNLGGGSEFSDGLWVFDLKADGVTKRHHQHVTSEKLKINMSFSIVSIDRPWLNAQLFSFKGWEVNPPYQKGMISGGDINISKEKKSVMPLIPNAFIVVKDVNIWAEWSESDKELIEKSINGNGDVSFLGLGNFGIGGEKQETKETFHSEFIDGTIKITGSQVLGWVSQIVPFCPSEE